MRFDTGGRLTMPKPAQHPNIILIITDDLGYGDLGCYGQRCIKTPHLDKLAAEGRRYTQAYAGCTVCTPSRAVLMTGRHGGHASVRANTGGVALPEGEPTIATVLQKAGYQCGGFGKWGLGDVDTSGVPERHGFHEFFGYYHQIHAHNYFPEYLWYNSQRVELVGNRDGATSEYSHARILAEMKRFIADNADRPFFCYAPWTLPHGRYELPADEPAWLQYADQPWSHEERAVAAMITLIDRSVGELVNLLDTLGIAEHTLVLFTSDNGGSMKMSKGVLRSNGVLRGGKGNLYEGGIRIPLICRWPGHVPPGTVSNRVCYFGDFLPTLADLAGVYTAGEGEPAGFAEPKGWDGLSFAADLCGEPNALPEHAYLYWENGGVYHYINPAPNRAVRKGDWKGVIPAADSPLELYNLANDISEEHDLSSVYPDVARELECLMQTAHIDPPPQIEPEKPVGAQYR